MEVSTEVLRGRPHLEISWEVLRGGHDLIMKEAEPNESVLFGSTDMHLLRTCPCPVWLLKPGHGDVPFSQILAAVDPAPPSDETDLFHLKAELAQKDEALDAKILKLAGSLAEREGAQLHVLLAWSAPGEGLVRGELIPADVIAEFAKSGRADPIVMGTVARTGIAGLLIGNTAETILQRVNCSVLAVKPDGFVSLVVQDTKAFSAVVLFTVSWGSSAGSGKQGNRDRIPLRPRS